MADPTTPEKADLVAAIQSDCAEAILAHRRVRLPSQLLRDLAAEAPSPELDRFLASHRDTPSRVLVEIAERSPSTVTRLALARHVRTPAQQLHELAEDGETDVRQSVAANSAVPPRVATQLIGDPAVVVRRALAANNAIPSRFQMTLAEDVSPLVRTQLLKQRRLESEVLTKLLNDPDPLVRARVIISGPLDERRQLRLADGEDPFEQHCLLGRRTVERPALESLAFSQHAGVQLKALERHELSTDELLGWARTGPLPVRCLVAATADLPPEIQDVLANDAEHDVLLTLAVNHTLAPGAAATLAGSSYPDVIHAVAANPAVPEAVLLCLCATEDELIPRIIAGRPELPAAVVERLTELGDGVLYHLGHHQAPCQRAIEGQAETLSWHVLPTLRVLAARADTLPEDAMARLSRDPAPLVRQAVAGNQNVPATCLDALIQDDAEWVANVATAERQRRREQAVDEDIAPTGGDGPLTRFVKRILRGAPPQVDR
ncbi:MAG: hypothetical protein HN742_22480 [Lentisphaerae bacterium]|jgi:hypothetical protein|nr:hypothetical protein [Lentisphaerota bacterium]MBT5605002.1 hypothetical protein [Lentisphaerota bacterium]MBT7054632.1 hypothetical protein [Lentisphaerota bacterium]MBT7844661.1 hypothetical protein [Lentisphaerota bacterium]